MRYLLFGASTAFGVGDPEHGGWQGRLREYLDEHEGERYFHNLAISGDTSADLLDRMREEAERRIRDKPREEWTILITIGTNDSKLIDGEPLVSEEEYRSNIRTLLEQAAELAGTVITLSGNPVDEDRCNPWKEKQVFLNERIKTYGGILEDVSAEHEVPFIDVFTPLADMFGENLTDDGLHPNKHGHQRYYEYVKVHMKDSL